MTGFETTPVGPARFDGTVAYVGTATGLTVVHPSGGGDGELADLRCGAVADVAVEDRLAVATREDVLVTGRDGTVEATGFGAATAVSFTDEGLLAGGPDGRVARRDDGWSTLGAVDEVRALDGALVGARDGVHRIVDGGLQETGLDDVRDVSAAGTPLVATADALYYLGPGWAEALDGPFVAVDADGDRAYAATDGALRERVDGDWRETSVSAAVDVDAAAGGYAVSADGDLFVRGEDGWRPRALGVDDATALAVA